MVRRGGQDARLRTGNRRADDELLLSHKHPDDRAHVQDLLDYALQSAESFSSRHRFVDTAGNVHDAIVVADRMLDESGAVVGTAGYYIDLTDTFDETRQEVLDEALPDLFESRAAIEQAKGVLMYVYRVSAEQAFRVLQWRSQETNVKLRALARQLLAEVTTLPDSTAAAPKSVRPSAADGARTDLRRVRWVASGIRERGARRQLVFRRHSERRMLDASGRAAKGMKLLAVEHEARRGRGSRARQRRCRLQHRR